MNVLLSSLRSRPWRVAGLFLVTVVLLLTVTSIEGTRGSLSDFRPVPVLRAMVGMAGPRLDPSPMSLFGDVATALLLLSFAVLAKILFRQWHLLADCLPWLRAAGVLRPAGGRRAYSGMAARLVLRELRDVDGEAALDHFVRRVTGRLTAARWLLFVAVSLPAVVAAAPSAGWQDRATARLALPPDLPPSQSELVAAVQAQWWAAPEQPLGSTAHGVLAFAAVYLLLSAVVVLLAAAYLGGLALYVVPRLAFRRVAERTRARRLDELRWLMGHGGPAAHGVPSAGALWLLPLAVAAVQTL